MKQKPELWTVVRLIEWSTQYLREKDVENPRLCVERLIGHVLEFDRVQLYLHFDRPLSPEELAAFKKLLLRKATREPLQYILGKTEFFSMDFWVEPGVLIPRPETELLLENAIALFQDVDQPISILDIGTGSGNIPVVLAKKIPQVRVISVDISSDALRIARKNAKHHDVTDKIEFIQMDISEPLPGEWAQKFDMIISNPPYIPSEEKKDLEPEVRDHEPAIALFSEDALLFYKLIAKASSEILKPEGYVICEIAFNQAIQVKSIFEKHAIQKIQIYTDLAGRDRIVFGSRPVKF